MAGLYQHTLYLVGGHELLTVLTPEQENQVREVLDLKSETRNTWGSITVDEGTLEIVIPFSHIVALAAPKKKEE